MKEEDQRTIDAVKETGLEYTLVDLGLAGATARLKARIDGIKITPTVVYRGQRLEGLPQILGMLKTVADPQQK